jgi:ribosome-binding protein aMBF1 (putative translation factor)
MKCEICNKEIVGQVAALSNLAEPPVILKVCEACAGTGWSRLDVDGVDVEVNRDDYLRADKERFEYAVGQAEAILDEHGWSLDGLTLRARSKLVMEPLD